MTDEKNEGIKFSIKRIKDLFFYINEPLYTPNEHKQVKVEFVPILGFKKEDNLVVLMIRVFYHYEEKEPLPENILIEIQVQNIFEISQLDTLINNDNVLILPSDVIVTLLSLSISHTRALLAKNSAGTSLQDMIMPVFNAYDAAKFFFPYMFEGDTTQVISKKGAIISGIPGYPKSKI